MEKKFLKKIILLCLSIFLLGLLLYGFLKVHQENKIKKAQALKTKQIFVAEMKTPVQKLYFTGALFPIQTTGVIAPVTGNITSIGFNYGERVIKDQVLLILHSSQLADNYRKSVNDFLQKKQTYQTDKNNFAGMQALYNAGTLSKNDFTAAKVQLETASLAFLQSEYELQKVLYTANVDPKKIESLSISDTEQVNTLLQRRFRHIAVVAPASGIALFPTEKTTSDGKSSSGKLTSGAEVKEGQLLLQLGDLSGFSATFDVSEVDIDRIKKNMEVRVTGNAFPGEELKGYVTSISSQANQSASDGNLSMFTVKIKIPEVTKELAGKIRVGMSAKFQIDIQSPPSIMLPIKAVFEKNGKSMVNILDEQGKEKAVPVVTGDTTLMHVVIVSGVKSGDKVVMHD